MGESRASGLDGIVVAETVLSDVDGERGQLTIRGHAIEELVERATFEQICGLMWNGAWPTDAERRLIGTSLADARAEAFAVLPTLGTALASADAMEALRAATGHLRAGDPIRDRYKLTGAIAVFAAAWARSRQNLPPIRPTATHSHAADLLQMLSGTTPDPARVRALDAYLCCVVDHGMNASTFTARVVASTASDLISAIVAALGALKGPLHGGAPGPVLDMLDAIGEPQHARAWLDKEIAAGHRIMGMGHRIYRVRDPRAAALERATAALQQSGVAAERLAIARAVEQEAERLLAERHPERALRANVEFYTAVLLNAVGIPRPLFSAVFAASRVVGWCAHVAEQQAVGRLIRPASKYVGPPAQ